jgi:hypothetical protein
MNCKSKDYKKILKISKKKNLKYLQKLLQNEKCLIYYEKIKTSNEKSVFVYQVF